MKQCDELVEKCNCAVVQLEKKFDNLLDKEVAERKRKEEEKILIDLKRDITNIDVELAKESLQHSTQYGERIRCIKKLSQSVKNTCVRHQGIIGADLLKRCDELVDKCNCAIAQLENEFDKLLAKEADEAMRARQLKIAQAMNRVEKRLQTINTQKTITYRNLVEWFNCILADCEFIVQYVSTNTIVNDLIAINNFFANWQKTNFRHLSSENLSKFEKAYPFVKKAKIVLEQERKREMWQRRQMNMLQMIKELTLPFYAGLGFALTLATIINGCVFLVYLTVPSLVEWGAVHAFAATWASVLGVFSFLVALSCIKEKLPNWCLVLLWLCGLILISCIILT